MHTPQRMTPINCPNGLLRYIFWRRAGYFYFGAQVRTSHGWVSARRTQSAPRAPCVAIRAASDGATSGRSDTPEVRCSCFSPARRSMRLRLCMQDALSRSPTKLPAIIAPFQRYASATMAVLIIHEPLAAAKHGSYIHRGKCPSSWAIPQWPKNEVCT